MPKLPLQALMLFALFVATVFLWELTSPNNSFAGIGFAIPIIYVIWFPREKKYGIILVSLTSGLIITDFVFNFSQIESAAKISVGLVALFEIIILWLSVYFNSRYLKTLLNENRFKEQLHSVFNNVTQGILVVDERAKIVLINAFAEKLFGYSPKELLGRDLNILVPKLNRFDHHQKMKEFTSGLDTRPMGFGRNTKAVRKDGVEFPVDISLSHFKNEEGAFVVAFILDLTEKLNDQEKIKQERKLADTYFDMAPALFLVLDTSGNVLSINNNGCQILGYQKPEVIGKNWFDNFLSEDIRECARTRFNTIKVGSLENAGEHPILTAGGDEIELSWQHVASIQGGKTIVLCSGIDIRERKKHEQLMTAHHQTILNLNEELEKKIRNRTKELQDTVKKLESVNRELDRSRSMLTTAIHHFPEGVIGVMNKSLRYVFADGQELQALGLHAPAENERVFDNVHPALSTATEEKLKWVFNGSRLSYDADLDSKTYSINAVPIHNPDGLINEIMVVIRNVTERKKLEEKLQRTIEKERELASMKSKFVTMASHEFRTPLATIASSAFLLENYRGDEYEGRKTKHLEKIKHAVSTMTELLNDFIQLGKLEEGKVKVMPITLDLNHLQEELETEVEVLKKNKQTLVWKIIGENLSVKLDKQLLRSTLINLIGNALKYSPEESEVKVLIWAMNKEIKFQVIDHGIGIPSEEQTHIFKRFFRAQNSINIGGTGLGLNIARKHVKLMNGRIEFKSKLNEGTTFTVTLPRDIEMEESKINLKAI